MLNNKLIIGALIAVIFTLATCADAFGQFGGKAEPNRIRFARGSDRTTLTGSLSNGQEMEYVLTARAGQTITIYNPTNSIFDVRVFSETSDIETEYDSSRRFSLELPADGDYLIFVRKKIAGPRRAKFSVNVQIR